MGRWIAWLLTCFVGLVRVAAAALVSVMFNVVSNKLVTAKVPNKLL